jgi:hypothetical protein
MSGCEDPVHLTRAIEDGRVFLTKIHDDFLNHRARICCTNPTRQRGAASLTRQRGAASLTRRVSAAESRTVI